MSLTDTETLEVEQRIQAPPETVFSFFTDPDKHCRWQGREAELDPRPGGAYRVNLTGRGWIRGEYVVVDPPHRLVITWGFESEIRPPPGMDRMPPGSTTVEITLMPDGDTTILRLRHSRVPAGDATAIARWAWSALYLRRLAVATEGGTPRRDPLPAMTRVAAVLPVRPLLRVMGKATRRAVR